MLQAIYSAHSLVGISTAEGSVLADGKTFYDFSGTIQNGEHPLGTVTQNTTAVLTPLTGRTLPGFLPLGWSPLQILLELASEPRTGRRKSLRAVLR